MQEATQGGTDGQIANKWQTHPKKWKEAVHADFKQEPTSVLREYRCLRRIPLTTIALYASCSPVPIVFSGNVNHLQRLGRRRLFALGNESPLTLWTIGLTQQDRRNKRKRRSKPSYIKAAFFNLFNDARCPFFVMSIPFVLPILPRIICLSDSVALFHDDGFSVMLKCEDVYVLVDIFP